MCHVQTNPSHHKITETSEDNCDSVQQYLLFDEKCEEQKDRYSGIQTLRLLALSSYVGRAHETVCIVTPLISITFYANSSTSSTMSRKEAC